MGIVTLGIGPPEPNITYLLTGGLNIGEPIEPVDIRAIEADVAVRLRATGNATTRLTATGDVRVEP